MKNLSFALIIFSIMLFPINANAIDADEDLLYDKGVENYNSGDYKQAIKDFEDALRLNPNNSEAKEYLEKALGKISVRPTADIFNFKDSRDNKTYKAVKIGEQTWMAENLNYNASGSKCYENKSDKCKEYGRLYNLEAAKKACPKGWHLPSNYEWDELITSVGGSETAGKYLKIGCGEWFSCGKYKSENKYGFSALPGGTGVDHAFGYWYDFFPAGLYGHWWSNDAHYYGMSYESEETWHGNENKRDLLSVRCLQDSPTSAFATTAAVAASSSSDDELKTRYGLRFAIPILNVDFDDGLDPDVGFGLNGFSFVVSIPLLNRLYIEPEIDLLNYRFFWNDWVKYEEYAISTPLTLRFVTNPPPSFGLYAEAGAQLDFAISTNYTEFEGEEIDESMDDRTFFGYGLVFGGGFQFNMGDMVVLLGYRYVDSFTDFLTDEGGGKLTQHQISLGLLF